ncbi:MAG TPA: alpha/beta hydrolase [Hyphomicrobiaceae bacterium]|jgi:pimeloyl-ACP methyl ester carboxylesterase|nr:alpha/beta hydrolase [Hyphomicrobiaceae bacterium]
MPHISTDDGIRLYYEEAGSGTPVLFVHEFAGDHRSWEPQLRYFSRRYRCITFNARGWPPSDVPQDVDRYSQARACEDVRAVLDALSIDKAHVVGLSMGGFAVLHFGLTHPTRARSLLVAGAGYGSEPSEREKFRNEAVVIAAKLEKEGMATFAEAYAYGPTRVQFENKDSRGFAEFKAMLAEHSAKGAANTQLGVQHERRSIFDLEDKLAACRVPMLVVTGDEDWPCLLPNLFIKRTCPTAGLLVIPNSGHAVNLEEPAAFNAALGDFLAQVDAGRWPMRDPRAVSNSITGMTK